MRFMLAWKCMTLGPQKHTGVKRPFDTHIIILFAHILRPDIPGHSLSDRHLIPGISVRILLLTDDSDGRQRIQIQLHDLAVGCLADVQLRSIVISTIFFTLSVSVSQSHKPTRLPPPTHSGNRYHPSWEWTQSYRTFPAPDG